jgi:outer membrane protein assembly factor BamB
LQKNDYAARTSHRPHQDFSVNSNYPDVSEKWRFDARWTMASSPAVGSNRVFAGDGAGIMRALSLKTGAPKWEFTAGGPIYSTPAVAQRRVVFSSVDGSVYALGTYGGRKLWQFGTQKPIVASPVIFGDVVYVGASDGKFRALGLTNGMLKWEFPGVAGFVRTSPLVRDGRVIFVASDEQTYALNAINGRLIWTTHSASAFWPTAAAGGKLFVVDPTELLVTALDLATGQETWHADNWPGCESIGLSADSSRLYTRSITNGAILAFAMATDPPEKLWESDADFGKDITFAVPVEKQGVLYYGTRNGLLLAIDPRSGTLLWKHKLGVTALNTVVPLEEPNEVLVSDADGRIMRVGPRQH